MSHFMPHLGLHMDRIRSAVKSANPIRRGVDRIRFDLKSRGSDSGFENDIRINAERPHSRTPALVPLPPPLTTHPHGHTHSLHTIADTLATAVFPPVPPPSSPQGFSEFTVLFSSSSFESSIRPQQIFKARRRLVLSSSLLGFESRRSPRQPTFLFL
ncbi:hypothetical protein PIB30_019922 [Stylosanthes scabra]|uniref:Uncharacterized protein n=1 Tax=Stylosanthes scabra TaxID=79078 RepID=A0ABU6V9Y7_9FABA|nr:hypothetical protein [Stylosanthes scabra]